MSYESVLSEVLYEVKVRSNLMLDASNNDIHDNHTKEVFYGRYLELTNTLDMIRGKVDKYLIEKEMEDE